MFLGEAEPMLPFGLGTEPGHPTEVKLQPNDLLLLYSDGLIEARAAGSDEEWGLERLKDMVTRSWSPDSSLPSMVRLVLDSVKEHSELDLRDDATLFAVRWLGKDQLTPEPNHFASEP